MHRSTGQEKTKMQLAVVTGGLLLFALLAMSIASLTTEAQERKRGQKIAPAVERVRKMAALVRRLPELLREDSAKTARRVRAAHRELQRWRELGQDDRLIEASGINVDALDRRLIKAIQQTKSIQTRYNREQRASVEVDKDVGEQI